MENKRIWHCTSLEKLTETASGILKHCISKKIAFSGELGAGKTTVIQVLCRLLGYQGIVSSPTFNLVNEYRVPNTIFHFDLYRLIKPEELYEIGYEEYFYSDEYVFIEWPEKADSLIPDSFYRIQIDVLNDNSRIFTCCK